MGDKIKVLITVKTCPLPSKKYFELVCTAGVREDGTFIRLYPIDYRYKPIFQQYKKYQWVKVEMEKNPNDPRPETYRLTDGSNIVPLGESISYKNNWSERKQFVLAKGTQEMCVLNSVAQTECSLGIIRPKRINNFVIEPIEREWKPEWKSLYDQLKLLGPEQKPLEKIPYKFSYNFICEEPGCKGHKMMIEDWEICELYRKMRDKYEDEAVAINEVKKKFFNQICASDRDTHFFVGTILKFGSWVILGAFWPKKEAPKLQF